MAADDEEENQYALTLTYLSIYATSQAHTQRHSVQLPLPRAHRVTPPPVFTVQWDRHQLPVYCVQPGSTARAQPGASKRAPPMPYHPRGAQPSPTAVATPARGVHLEALARCARQARSQRQLAPHLTPPARLVLREPFRREQTRRPLCEITPTYIYKYMYVCIYVCM